MTDEEMDNFVFAVLPKKTAAKMQKELQDLVQNKCIEFGVIHCLDVPFIIVLYKKNSTTLHCYMYILPYMKSLFAFFCFRPSSALINAVVPSMIFLLPLLC